MQPVSREFDAMNKINTPLNQHQISPLHEIHHHQMLANSQFDPATLHDDFLEQFLSTVPSSVAASFPWAEDHVPPHLEESDTLLAAKLRRNQISSTAKALMIQQQLLFSRGLTDGGLLSRPQDDQSDVVDGNSFNSANPANDASVKALFNGFTGSLGQTSNQPQHFLHPQALQAQNFGSAGAAASPPTNQPAAICSSGGGGAAAQPRQRVRARRGQATDPHSIAERLRRERIAERMKALQELVPNANKTNKSSMLDEIIDYVKFLQLQVKILSMSRLGSVSAVATRVTDMSSEGRGGNGTQTVSSSNNNDGMTVTEHQVAKLMEEDMGSAMQYLQGKGLCLMPISLATAISTATSHSRKPLAAAANKLTINGTTSNNPLLNGEARGPTSPSMSALTVQSATKGGNGSGEPSLKDATSVFP